MALGNSQRLVQLISNVVEGADPRPMYRGRHKGTQISLRSIQRDLYVPDLPSLGVCSSRRRLLSMGLRAG